MLGLRNKLKSHRNGLALHFTSDVVLAYIEVSLHVQGKATGSHAAAELVEHAGVEYPRGLLEEAQDPVRHHLRHESVV